MSYWDFSFFIIIKFYRFCAYLLYHICAATKWEIKCDLIKKIERYHSSIRNVIKLNHYFCPSKLKRLLMSR